MRSDGLFFLALTISVGVALPLLPSSTTPPPTTTLNDSFNPKTNWELKTVHNGTYFVQVSLGIGYLEDSSQSTVMCQEFEFRFNSSESESEKMEEIVQEECKGLNRPMFKRKKEDDVSGSSSSDEIYEMTKWEGFRKDVFRKNDIRYTLEYFKIDKNDFMDKFGIDHRFGVNALQDFEQEVYCLTDGRYTLQVCGPTNPTRQYGVIQEIIPHGSFTNKGQVYRYHDMPQYALQLDDHLKSTGQCRQIGICYAPRFACSELSDNTCTVANFARCPIISVATPETLFVARVQELFFIATDSKIHPTFTLEQEELPVPTDGAFLTSFPYNDTLKIGSISIEGRYGGFIQKLFMLNVTMLQKFPDVTHDDLYMAVRNGYMHKADAQAIHKDLYNDNGFFSTNTLSYWITYWKYLAWYYKILIVAVVAFIATHIFVAIIASCKARISKKEEERSIDAI